MNGLFFIDEPSGRFKMVEVYASNYAILFSESTSEGTFKQSMILEVNNKMKMEEI